MTEVTLKDKDLLNELSFIYPKPGEIFGTENIKNYASTKLPSSISVIEKMEK